MQFWKGDTPSLLSRKHTDKTKLCIFRRIGYTSYLAKKNQNSVLNNKKLERDYYFLNEIESLELLLLKNTSI